VESREQVNERPSVTESAVELDDDDADIVSSAAEAVQQPMLQVNCCIVRLQILTLWQ